MGNFKWIIPQQSEKSEEIFSTTRSQNFTREYRLDFRIFLRLQLRDRSVLLKYFFEGSLFLQNPNKELKPLIRQATKPPNSPP